MPNGTRSGPIGREVLKRIGSRVRQLRAHIVITIASLACIVLTAAVLARDNSGMFQFLREQAGSWTAPERVPSPSLSPPPLGRSLTIHRAVHRSTHPQVPQIAGLSRRAVCVRLCDGAYFPVGDVADLYAAGRGPLCSSLCPGAPTRVYVIPEGAEKIDTATAGDGHAYSQLPTAFRFTKIYDSACTCRRPERSPAMSVASDLTLRPGDAIMTQKGLRVFVGHSDYAHSAKDFVALAQSGRRLQPETMSLLIPIAQSAALPR